MVKEPEPKVEEKPKEVVAQNESTNEELEKLVKILSRVRPGASEESIRQEAATMITAIDVP